jgi:hypothetical protein
VRGHTDEAEDGDSVVHVCSRHWKFWGEEEEYSGQKSECKTGLIVSTIYREGGNETTYDVANWTPDRSKCESGFRKRRWSQNLSTSNNNQQD